jgi:hypothetical protein
MNEFTTRAVAWRANSIEEITDPGNEAGVCAAGLDGRFFLHGKVIWIRTNLLHAIFGFTPLGRAKAPA